MSQKIPYANGITIVKEGEDRYWVMVATGQGGLDYDSYPKNEHGDPAGFLPTLEDAQVEAARLDNLNIAWRL